MQTGEQLTQRACIIDDGTKVWSGAHFTACHFKGCFFEASFNEEVLKGCFVLDILRGLAARHLIERRLRDVDMTALDEFRHLAEEEGQQQRTNMRTVDVSIRHDDNLVVAQLIRVEAVSFIFADGSAERCNQGADLIR